MVEARHLQDLDNRICAVADDLTDVDIKLCGRTSTLDDDLRALRWEIDRLRGDLEGRIYDLERRCDGR
jgi:hypothetical protein